MTAEQPFEDALPAERRNETELIVDLDGYEGPLDVLLSLAREQKVDLARISILKLTEQYIEFITTARRLRLEIAADYLVMAAWLAYLKSRLLLPEPAGEEGHSAQEMADALAFQLRRLEAMREAGVQIMARPRLGLDHFVRGEPERFTVLTRPIFELSLYELLSAYGAFNRRLQASTLTIGPQEVYSMDDALKRLSEILAGPPDWQTLMSFLPPGITDDLLMRSAIAATFAASLEFARSGKAQLRQHTTFGPIYFRRKPDPI